MKDFPVPGTPARATRDDDPYLLHVSMTVLMAFSVAAPYVAATAGVVIGRPAVGMLRPTRESRTSAHHRTPDACGAVVRLRRPHDEDVALFGNTGFPACPQARRSRRRPEPPRE